MLGALAALSEFLRPGTGGAGRFDTADGIYAGKTEVRCRSVKVGVVKDVKLADDLKSVRHYPGIRSGCRKDLLRSGTRFWVVKPRLSATEFSGVGTLITGAYIELDPGPPSGDAVERISSGWKPRPRRTAACRACACCSQPRRRAR